MKGRIKKKKSKHCASEYFSTIGYQTLPCTSNRSKAKHSMAQTIPKERLLFYRGKKQKRKKKLIKSKNKIKTCPLSDYNK